MDILLIDPPYRSLKGMSMDCGYNVGLTSLAAYLRQEGITSAVLMGDLLMDLRRGISRVLLPGVSPSEKKYAAGQREYDKIVNDRTHVIWEKIADVVKQTKPMAVGIQYLSPSKYVFERVASLIRETDKDIKIIAGSFHPTFCPEEVMQNPDIDFIIRGEGETPLLSLLQELKKDSPKCEEVLGINYRNSDGQVKSNPGAPLISNLDELPFLARDLVLNCDYDVYHGHTMATARGCPYKCAFCADRRLWDEKVRRRSVDNVIEELKLLKDTYRKISFIDIVDGTFTYDRKYVQTFCNAVIENKLDIGWRCTARYDNLDEELLQLMKKSNCTGLYLGLESGSNRVLESINKKTNVEENIKVSKMVRSSGIPVATAILLGTPDERKEDIEETLKLMKKVKTDLFDVNSYMPLPGTPFYDVMNEEERKNIDWRKVGLKSFDNYFVKSISHNDFKEYLSKAYNIANNVRTKTIIRFGFNKLFNPVARLFKK